MQLSVTGHHVDITEAMSNYVNSNLSASSVILIM